MSKVKTKEFLWTSASNKWPEIWVAAWTDPCSEIKSVWMTPEEVKKVNPLECLAVGFLVERTKSSIKLSSTACANGCSGQIITIPIKSLTLLEKLADVGKSGVSGYSRRPS